MSIRMRFTLFYSLLLAGILVLFGLLLYVAQARVTLDALKRDMGKTAGFVSLFVQDNNGNLPSTEDSDEVARPLEEYDEARELGRLPKRELIRLLAADGSVIASPGGSDEELPEIDEEELASLQAGNEMWGRDEIDEDHYLVYNKPISIGGEVAYIVQVARPLTEQERSVRFLGLILLGFGVLMVLIAVGVGWWFSGVTLAPIQKITHTALAIGQEKDFGKRVQYHGPRDEVGQLAHTFNGMLEALQESYRQVAHSLEMQRDFVADVSHELRTPLTTLTGNIGLLRRKPPLPAGEQKEILVDVSDEADRMIRLVNELLVLARADAGRHLAAAAFDPATVMDDVARQARILAPERQISSRLANGLAAYADKDAVKQILLIGIDNALKHSGGAISLSVQAGQSTVQMIVQDEGEGIDSTRIPHLFDRFYRGEDAATIPGFGLGLPIARSLARAMAGDVELISQPNVGTRFVLTLPLAGNIAGQPAA